VPSFGPASSHVELKHDGPIRQMSLNKALVAFEQVISSGLLDRTNVRICHYSRPIYVSDVMSRYDAVSHAHDAVAVWDPKLSKYVVSVAHGPTYELGQLID
jgi:CRISPR-associated protein Csx3